MAKLPDFSPKIWTILLENIDFTDRELNAINFARRGFFWTEIAVELNISESTAYRLKTEIASKILDFMQNKC